MDPVSIIFATIGQGFQAFGSHAQLKGQRLAGEQAIDAYLYEQNQAKAQQQLIGLYVGVVIVVLLALVLIFRKK